MSRITYRPLVEGETRDVTRVNDILAAIETASALLQPVNFAEEGFTAVKTAYRPRTLDEVVIGLTRTTVPVNASFTQFVMGDPVTMRTVTGPFTLLTGDLMRCRARIHLNTVPGSTTGISNGHRLRFRMAYDDGTTKKVPYSERGLMRNLYTDNLLHGVMFLEGWLIGPATINWVELQQTLASGGSASVERCSMWLNTFHRTNVL